MPPHRDRIIGIDFSGAMDAGRKIWIATCNIISGRLAFEDCFPAKDLPGSSSNRDICLHTLGRFIALQGNSICGMDFPFGLPHKLVKEVSWDEFVVRFGDYYRSPLDFKQTCLSDSNGHERRRVTDHESKTPFSPYNLRLFRQTYYGICYIIGTLVKQRTASILPMQRPSPKKPWVVEVCPASTLRKLGLYHHHYKGSKKENKDARVTILDSLKAGDGLLMTKTVTSRVVEDSGGDALDSIIAATATFHSRDNLTDSHLMVLPYTLEGYVYV